MNTNYSADNCPSCNALVTANYCAECGEKKSSKHDFAMRHVVEESIEGFTHFDNKFFRSVKLLIARPGLLSCYFSIGRRIAYMKPLQLFIVCNLLFFFLAGTANMFSLTLRSYDVYEPYTNFNTHKIISGKVNTEEQFNTLSMIFNERMHTQSKAFIIFFIPLFAIFCAAFFFRSKKFFSEHLVFATYFFSFMLLYFLTFHYIVEAPFYRLNHSEHNSTFDLITTFLSISLCAVYFSMAAKRFYKVSTLTAMISAVSTGFLFILLLYAYRLLLFFKIIYSS